MIRLVASDMDGTFLSYNGNISEENVEAVRRLNQAGIIFVAASGRDYPGISSLLKPYDLNFEAILSNGAEYADEKGNTVLTSYLSADKAKEILDVFDHAGVHSMLFTKLGTYTHHDPKETAKAYINRCVTRFHLPASDFEPGGPRESMAGSFHGIQDLDSFLNTVPVMKVEAWDVNQPLLDTLKKEVARIEGIYAMSAAIDNLEVTDVHAVKGLVLEKVCEQKGIRKDEVMVLGDGMNDLSLFQCFPKNSCAVENAAEPVKQAANRIVPHCNENGFAYAIQTMLENQ